MAKKPNKQIGQPKIAEEISAKNPGSVSRYLSKVKFAPRFMGVDEADVWKKIEKLCELYEDELAAERARSEELEHYLLLCSQKLKGVQIEEDEPNG